MKQTMKKCITLLCCVVLLCTTLFSNVEIKGQTQNKITIYFIDQTKENWVKNDGAVMELVDNSFGHDSYPMTKIDDTVWSVSVPKVPII